MARGPKPKPVELHVIEGTFRADRHGGGVNAPAGKPTCPRWLSKRAKTEWRRIVPELEGLGLLTQLDRAALAAYCQAVSELEEATEILERDGRLLHVPIVSRDSKTGRARVLGHKTQAHPAVKLQRDAFARVRAYLVEFGLSPSSRTRLRAPAKESNMQGGVQSRKRG